MILEAFKIVSSVFPFIKEAFLWREGADANKPVTPADLRRRKIAVFGFFVSLVINYLAIAKLYEVYVEDGHKTQEITTLKTQLDKSIATQQGMVSASNCIAPNQVFDLVNKQVETEIEAGVLVRTAPPAIHRKPASKPAH